MLSLTLAGPRHEATRGDWKKRQQPRKKREVNEVGGDMREWCALAKHQHQHQHQRQR